jgi:hypothetical protein
MDSFLTHTAYLDAGTGSIIIQAIVGVTAGIGLFARRKVAPIFSKIIGLFAKKSTDAKADED